MIAVPTLFFAVTFVSGSATVKLASTWPGERTGWLLLFLSCFPLLSLAARA